ncbi:MAG TPA: serine hydrolase domain-containing protein [Gemmatimonadales bacterium]|nr:beta-lactamase family protein [Gemmatimonadota bacterium]MCB9504534.1 beta-lactamase family protein [Gemmatimonadales bacterium]MCB9518107.1 beta-lactamase family protein [Gemmatimonadales bacterium]HPF60746.1 serine hydrolase domain-containing protein [Gemmatimonadales bacterium]
MRLLPCLAAALLGGLLPLAAQADGSARLDTAAVARLTRYLDGVVARGEAAGIVAEVRQHGEVIYRHATGMADREAGRPMAPRSLFRIASQTKAITTAAALTLVEEGRLALGDPISRYLPAFAGARVAERYDSAGAMRVRTVPVARPITVRDLMTHTAGMSYGRESWLEAEYAARGLGPEAGAGWYFAHKSTDICTAVAPLAELPLAAQPGSRFVYGYGTDVLGCLIETITGQGLAEVVQQRITGPLGMDDTRFCLDARQARALTVVYALQGGTLSRAPDGPLGQGDYVDGPCRAFAGGAGLISTAPDYATFLEMIRRGGTLDGHRILSPATVRLMTHDVLGETYRADGIAGFGLGFEVWHRPARAGRFGAPGQFGWGGAYHTNYWVDPTHELVAVVMTQLLPANGSTLHDRYRTLVYQMLEAPTHDGPSPE